MENVWFILGLMVFGCGSTDLKQRVATDAAEHWKCQASKIKVEQLDENTYRARGCEHEADYSCASEASATDKECERVSGM